MPTYINEASAMTVQARFFDDSGDGTVPTTVQYLIRDVSNDRLVRSWTAIPASEAVDIEITAEDNTIEVGTRSQKRFEKRVVTVQANAGLSTQCTNEYEYWLRNLAGIDND